MALAVKLSDIKMEVLPEHKGGYEARLMLPGEIPGASVFCHHIPKEYALCFIDLSKDIVYARVPSCTEFLYWLFLPDL